MDAKNIPLNAIVFVDIYRSQLDSKWDRVFGESPKILMERLIETRGVLKVTGWTEGYRELICRQILGTEEYVYIQADWIVKVIHMEQAPLQEERDRNVTHFQVEDQHLIALCDDSTLWDCYLPSGEWNQVPEVPND